MLVVSTHALGRVLRDARLAKGWTQGDLAERVGLTQASVSTIERAQSSPNFDTLLRLLGALGLDLHVVARGDKP